MDDLITSIQYKQSQLNQSVKMLRKSGEERARAERDYKVALRTEALKLRADGMPIGMIDKVVYGIPEVAELRMKRDIAETVYQANLEAINSVKLEIRILNDQIEREWHSG